MASKTIEQERAAHALAGVKNARDNGVSKEFKSYANGLPIMIHTNGLGQATAFFMGKNEKEYETLLELLKSWLTSKGRPYSGYTDLLAAITETDMGVYMSAQAEAMAYLVWVKKFSKALIVDENGVQNEQSAAI